MKVAYEYYKTFCSEQDTSGFYTLPCPELTYCDKVCKLPKEGYRYDNLPDELKKFIEQNIDVNNLFDYVRTSTSKGMSNMLIDLYENFYAEFGECDDVKNMYKADSEEIVANRIKSLLATIMYTTACRIVPAYTDTEPKLDEVVQHVYILFEKTEMYTYLVANVYMYFWYIAFPLYLDELLKEVANDKSTQLYRDLSKALTRERTTHFNEACSYARWYYDQV